RARAAYCSVHTSVVPSPAITVPPILVAIDVAEEPFVSLLKPTAPASLVPLDHFGPRHRSPGPSPVMAVLPILVAVPVPESPCILLMNPSALASLVPIVGSDQARRKNKRTDQNHNRY